MSSTFTGVSIANRGLSVSQTALSITTSNISNVNTDGYSRQVATQIAVGPAAVYNTSTVGAGAEVTSINRVRSFRLDQKYWQENSSLGTWNTKTDSLTEVEEILGTASDDTEFSTTMEAFYSALSNLSSDASSTSTRATVQETGSELCSYLNSSAEKLTQLRSDINTDVKTTVDEINSYARQVADLNQQISAGTASGASTNELEDKRDLLIDKLSQLADITVTTSTITTHQTDNSTTSVYNISIAGSNLVSGNNVRQLECDTISSGDNAGMYAIKWSDTGADFSTGESGTLKAYLDLRDGSGNNGESKGIPYYTAQLNEFAQTFAEAFNEGTYKDGSSYYSGHADGYGSDGSTGIRFFTYDSLSSTDFEASGTDDTERYANITAANISLSSNVKSDSAKIAASSSANEASNNENAADLISICKDSRMFASGTPEDFYNSIIATLGTETSYATRQQTRQDSLVSYIDTNRTAVSGVSSNEETANLTKYQEAYAASAKALSTWNEVLSITINMVSSD